MLPELAHTEGNQSRQALIRQIADENNFTIRQLYQWVASARGHFTVVGTPVQIADTLQEWFENEGADGFNILPPWLPTGLTDFVDLVIPELQRRGLLFVGLDVIGDCLTEINVTSPTCARELDAAYALDIGGQLMQAISARLDAR